MKYLIAIAALASLSASALAAETPPLPTPPSVTLTQSELTEHDELVSRMAVLNYMAQEASQKALGPESKIAAAFRPAAPSASAAPRP